MPRAETRPETVTVTLNRHRVEQVILPQLERLPDLMPLLSAPQRGALRDLIEATKQSLDASPRSSSEQGVPEFIEKLLSEGALRVFDGEFRKNVYADGDEPALPDYERGMRVAIDYALNHHRSGQV